MNNDDKKIGTFTLTIGGATFTRIGAEKGQCTGRIRVDHEGDGADSKWAIETKTLSSDDWRGLRTFAEASLMVAKSVEYNKHREANNRHIAAMTATMAELGPLDSLSIASVSLQDWSNALRALPEAAHNLETGRLKEPPLPGKGWRRWTAMGVLANMFVNKYPALYRWTKKGKLKRIGFLGDDKLPRVGNKRKSSTNVFDVIRSEQVTGITNPDYADVPTLRQWDLRGSTFKQIATNLEYFWGGDSTNVKNSFGDTNKEE